MRNATAYFCLAATLGLAAHARADLGRIEITRDDFPVAIYQPGTYLLMEDVIVGSNAVSTLVPAGSVWRYKDDGSNQGTAWREPTFNDGTWASGPAELGYGDADQGRPETTVVSFGSDPDDKHPTTYFRHDFTVSGADTIDELTLYLLRDDGAVVYLNGSEIVREKISSGTVTYDEYATRPPVSNQGEDTFYDFDIWPGYLEEGANTLAVEIHQINARSSDLSFDLYLTGRRATGGESNHGIFIAANNVTLDLGGHMLLGSDGTRDGIHVESGNNVEIRNGTVAQWGDDGVYAEITTNLVVRDLRVLRNYSEGIVGGTASIISDCVSSENGIVQRQSSVGNGVKVEHGSLVKDCMIYGNFEHGIVSASATEISGCMISEGGHDGLHGGQGHVVSRTSSFRNLGEGLEVEGGSVVRRCSAALNLDDGIKTRGEGRTVFSQCTAYDNRNDGLKTQQAALITRCSAFDNGDDGITLSRECLVIDNVSRRNGHTAGGTPGGGVNAESRNNRIARNHVTGNEVGIRVPDSASAAVDNLITENSAGGNDTNYEIKSGNKDADIETSTSSANAWANFLQ